MAVARCSTMASMPKGRMGPPPRSLAVDAHDCIMVGSQGSTAYKVVARDRCCDLAGSPQIVALPESCACTDPDLSPNVELQQESPPTLCSEANGSPPLSLGTRFRRQPLAPSGATLRALGGDRSARPSRGACRAHECRRAPRASRNATSVGGRSRERCGEIDA